MARPQTPLLAVDVIVEIGTPVRVGLGRRRNPPNGWAIPGGFVDIGETVAQAARRELLEEAALDVELTGLLGRYSNPPRGPRGPETTLRAWRSSIRRRRRRSSSITRRYSRTTASCAPAAAARHSTADFARCAHPP